MGAPETTLPASAEALALSRATRYGVVTVVAAVVLVVVSVVWRGRVVARVDGTGNLPAPPTVAGAAAVGAVVAVVAAFSSLFFFLALTP